MAKQFDRKITKAAKAAKATKAGAAGKSAKVRKPVKTTPGATAAAVLPVTVGATDTIKPAPTHRAGGGFPIVGIGASAGGLEAFEAFLSGMPPKIDPGMAFVLVQHLAPDHKSILTELIRHYTRMQVFEVEDGMVLRPNCTYIIPPGRDMAILNGTLQLFEPVQPRGQRLPIDFLFRSLAQDQRERAIGVVLSGTGSDGTHGVRAIKAAGGMVMVQNPASAAFDGMPRNAIATGVVDFELPPAEMAAQLIAHVSHAFGKLPRIEILTPPKVESALKKIFVLVRTQTGHDFSLYKPATIHRRIERRMTQQQIATIEGYVRYLQQTPDEVQALFHDLLIGVTSFFRDPAAFQVLASRVIPRLFENQHAGATIRVWVPGCSTGEEAYSLAMLLVERMETLKTHYTVQMFATDIDAAAVATARTGVYPASIAADISPERLARFFSTEEQGSGYRIQKAIRDMMVFSTQDLARDPPFSRLDLISCRNLLIYMGAALQNRIIPLFHYALKADGFLFLGTSEGIGEFEQLFGVLDNKAKLFQCKPDPQNRRRFPHAQLPEPPSTPDAPTGPRRLEGARHAKAPDGSLRGMTERALLSQVVAAGALVNGQGDILYLHGRTGMFLEPAEGEAGINNILKMAREGLRSALATSLHKAVKNKQSALCPGLRVKTNGHHTLVNLAVRPVTSGPGASAGSPLYLVVLEEAPIAAAPLPAAAALQDPARAARGSNSPAASARISALTAELLARNDELKSTREELESSNEELKSSNEEMQSVNEEMQSTNEELETSKEELQSVNEELSTVNAELQAKVSDLSRANNDMNNLLAGTGIGTVFVDHQLHILRFTPAVAGIINLIPSDVGRPITHIVANLPGYANLAADVQAVLDTLVAREIPVHTMDEKYFTMRIQPYRTLDNMIEGAVISFLDITELTTARNALREALAITQAHLLEANALARLAVVLRDASDAITMQDLQGMTLAWNPGATRLYGWSEAEALRMNVRERIPAPLQTAALATLERLGRAEVIESYSTQRLDKSGALLEVSIIATALLDDQGQLYAIATTERAKKP